MKYRRIRRNVSPQVKALAEAQKIAFAPMTFQAAASMIELGIFDFLECNPNTLENIMANCNISKYTAETLLEVGIAANLIEKNKDLYSITSVAEALLNNKMTKVNFNFIKDVCYLGASELTNSFVKEEPLGFKKFLGNQKTIYNALHLLPEQVKKSWFEFDHFYSDRCFEDALKIIFQKETKEIFDIGGNTGKFEKACLEFNKDCIINMIDLPENIPVAKQNLKNDRIKFHGIDVLDKNSKFPKITGAVFMSQFLDCFSEEQIISILSNIKNSMDDNTRIYILEPFTDKQIFDGATYSLVHISLYFTCMANGNSKMYSEKRMIELVEKAGLKVANKHENVGIHDYTLLECCK